MERFRCQSVMLLRFGINNRICEVSVISYNNEHDYRSLIDMMKFLKTQLECIQISIYSSSIKYLINENIKKRKC